MVPSQRSRLQKAVENHTSQNGPKNSYLFGDVSVQRRIGRPAIRDGRHPQLVNVQHMGSLCVYHQVPCVVKDVLALDAEQRRRSVLVPVF